MVLQNVNAYVVGDHYTAPWELPATKKYVDKGLTYLEALQKVLKEQGKQPHAPPTPLFLTHP